VSCWALIEGLDYGQHFTLGEYSDGNLGADSDVVLANSNADQTSRAHGRYTAEGARVIPFTSRRKNGARGGSRTHMRKNPRRILSPQRLPFRHPGIGSSSLIVQAYGHPPLCFLNPFLAPLCMFCVFRRPAASATSLPDGEW